MHPTNSYIKQIALLCSILLIASCSPKTSEESDTNAMTEEASVATEEYNSESEINYEEYVVFDMDDAELLESYNIQFEEAFEDEQYFVDLEGDTTIETENDYQSQKDEIIKNLNAKLRDDIEDLKKSMENGSPSFNNTRRMRVREWKAFNTFLIKLLGLQKKSAYHYTKKLKRLYEDRNDSVRLKKLKSRYESFKKHQVALIDGIVIHIKAGGVKELNKETFENLVESTAESYNDLFEVIEEKVTAARVDEKPKVLYASFFQENNSNTNDLAETKLGLEVAKLKLDIASGVFGLVNSVIALVNNGIQNKRNRIANIYNLTKAHDWSYF